MSRSFILFLSLIIISFLFGFIYITPNGFSSLKYRKVELNIKEEKAAGTIAVYREDVQATYINSKYKTGFPALYTPNRYNRCKGCIDRIQSGEPYTSNRN